MRDFSSLEEIQTGVIRFLASPVIANGHGSIYSWINPDHPGFVYPESMGLYLRLMSHLASTRKDKHLVDRVHAVAAGLQGLTPPSGGVGMAGNIFLFDTCMAVAGLTAYKRLVGGKLNMEKFSAMARFVENMTRRRLALLDEAGGQPKVEHHWSTIYGAQMLKTVIALDSLATETGERKYRSLAAEVGEEVEKGCLKEGAFRIGPTDTVVYCHAHCYALEGLLYLREKGYRDTTATLRIGADRLSGWQNEDGAMYNWYEDPSRNRAKVGDASAQSVRIWLAVDREKYAREIDRGLGFLASLRAPESGGLYYAAGSRDVNSITSIFAAQAMEWYLRGAQPEWLA